MAGISLHSAQRQRVLVEMPSHFEIAAVVKRGSGLRLFENRFSIGLSFVVVPLRGGCQAKNAFHNDYRRFTVTKSPRGKFVHGPQRGCRVVGTGRFELPTCRLGGDRSIHLSYVPTMVPL
jgi:hypothetical protein